MSLTRSRRFVVVGSHDKPQAAGAGDGVEFSLLRFLLGARSYLEPR
jgi:hypothetical protein